MGSVSHMCPHSDDRIINVRTGEIRNVDRHQVPGRGMPEGFKWMDEATKEELANALSSMCQKGAYEKFQERGAAQIQKSCSEALESISVAVDMLNDLAAQLEYVNDFDKLEDLIADAFQIQDITNTAYEHLADAKMHRDSYPR